MRLLTHSFVTLVSFTVGLASAKAQVFTVGNGSGNVGAFNATTGAVINDNLLSGLANPAGLAVSGNALYVTTEPSQGSGTVTRYAWNGTSATNPTAVVTGLNSPAGLTISGSTLFVVDNLNGSVAAYDTTGGTLSYLYSVSQGYPESVAVSGNTLFVGSLYSNYPTHQTDSGTIEAYNAATGAYLGTVATGLHGLTSLAISGSTLYAAQYYSNSVASFTISGSSLTNENASFVTGLNTPRALGVDGSWLLIGDWNDTPYNDNSSVIAVSSATGALIQSAFIPQYSGIDAITGIAVVSAVPEPSSASWALGSAALLGCALWRFRRQRALA